ncbi:MAG: DedA family protein [Candidatus Komeilibacteria bacterium]|nr:DedA family protein [Candidatus Komeilibacteria bacterium]
MINDFLLVYGYLALVIALILEGQPVLILIGFLISVGVFHWWPALTLGIPAMFFGDWLWWYGGYTYGYSFIDKFGKYFFITKRKLTRLTGYVKGNNADVIFGSKFVYGTGHIMLLLWGIAREPFKKFWQLNFVGNVLSYLLFTSLGYYFGQSLQTWNWYVRLGGLILFIGILWSMRLVRQLSFFKNLTSEKDNGG